MKLGRRRLQRIASGIAVAGLASAVVISLLVRPPAENPLGYDPLDTKKYVHDLELYGGKANVLAEEFREWFTGLWQGRNLALTIAALAFILFLAIRWVAARMPLEEAEDDFPPPAA